MNPTISLYGIWPELHDYTKKMLKGKAIISAEPLSQTNLRTDTEILGVFVDSMVTADIIAQMPKLKLIVSMSTGYDHIDLAAAKKRKITVCNVPSYGENTVAEHTFALILGLTRKLFPSVKRVKEGVYDFHGLRGVDLKGKTLGVIGTGRIGQHLIRMAKGFEMNVVGFDAFPNRDAAKHLGFTYTTLPRLLALSDVVSLHTPLTKQTYHLINKKTITKMKRGSFLVNTARGALVDPEALVAELKSGRLAGVGLDVLEDENLVQHEDEILRATTRQLKTNLLNNILINHPNVIVTPHNAFNSVEALQRIITTTVENITAFQKGKVVNVVK